jgi:hypothetical protein
LSFDLAYRDKIANEQNARLADQTTLNLFEFAQKTNPSLASRYRDTYVELHMQEELLRVQQGGILQQPLVAPPPQRTQVGSFIQEGDKEEGEEDEEAEGGDDEEDEYAIENLLYYGMHDEGVNSRGVHWQKS